MRALQFLTCHVLDSMCNLLVRGGGDGTQHLLQVGHPQVGMGPFPPAHRRLLAHFLFGRLSVDLSQVRTLGFGQFALCRDSEGKQSMEVALLRLKPSNGPAAGPEKRAGSERRMPGNALRIPYAFCPTPSPERLRSCQRAGFDDWINSSECCQPCGNKSGWPLLSSKPLRGLGWQQEPRCPARREASVGCPRLWVITAAPVIATLTQMTEIIF